MTNESARLEAVRCHSIMGAEQERKGEKMSQEIIEVIREGYDPGDKFGWCQVWRFGICDYLVWDLGADVPGFYPGSWPDTDSYNYMVLVREKFDEDELKYALKILDRYREWLRLAGEDY